MKPTESLKTKIKKKFGTYSNFTRIAGIDRYEFQRDFLCKEKVEDYYYYSVLDDYKKLRYQPKRTPLDSKRRKWIKESIDELGGVIDFCQKEKFSRHTVFQVISGYYEVVTPNIEKLINIINERLKENELAK